MSTKQNNILSTNGVSNDLHCDSQSLLNVLSNTKESLNSNYDKKNVAFRASFLNKCSDIQDTIFNIDGSNIINSNYQSDINDGLYTNFEAPIEKVLSSSQFYTNPLAPILLTNKQDNSSKDLQHDASGRSTFSLLSNNGFGTCTTASSTPSHLSEILPWAHSIDSAINNCQKSTTVSTKSSTAEQPCSKLDKTWSNFSVNSSFQFSDSDWNQYLKLTLDDDKEVCPKQSDASWLPYTLSDAAGTERNPSAINESADLYDENIKLFHNYKNCNPVSDALASETFMHTRNNNIFNENWPNVTNIENDKFVHTPCSTKHLDANTQLSWIYKNKNWNCGASEQNIHTIPKSINNFYAAALASKRWQNLNVVFPLFAPHGKIAVLSANGQNTYVFPDTHPEAQLLLSNAGQICDVWASYLRLRVAVVHKCPDFLVPRLAQIFNKKLASLPKYAEPIILSCSGLVKHTIQLRSSGGVTFRYDTIGQILRKEDHCKMKTIFAALQTVLKAVNTSLVQEVERVFKQLHNKDFLPFDHEVDAELNFNSGLEFRFSPCKELKIVLREGTPCQCSGVDALIAGGGALSMSSWAQQFTTQPLIIGEVRLEQDKSTEVQLDPFFTVDDNIKTRMIVKDLEGKSARVVFVNPQTYPTYYKPEVVHTPNSTPLQAAQIACGATHATLAKMLPNGMASLLPESNKNHYTNSSILSVNETPLSYRRPLPHTQTFNNCKNVSVDGFEAPSMSRMDMLNASMQTTNSILSNCKKTSFATNPNNFEQALLQTNQYINNAPPTMTQKAVDLRAEFLLPAKTSSTTSSHVLQTVEQTLAALKASANELPLETTQLLSQLQTVLENSKKQQELKEDDQIDREITKNEVKQSTIRFDESNLQSKNDLPTSTIVKKSEAPLKLEINTCFDTSMQADSRTESDCLFKNVINYPTSKSLGATPNHKRFDNLDDNLDLQYQDFNDNLWLPFSLIDTTASTIESVNPITSSGDMTSHSEEFESFSSLNITSS